MNNQPLDWRDLSALEMQKRRGGVNPVTLREKIEQDHRDNHMLVLWLVLLLVILVLAYEYATVPQLF